MLAVTTRASSDDQAILFTGDRGREVGYANLVVSIPPNRAVGTVQWPQSSPGNPATEFVVARSERLSHDDLLKWFKERNGGSRRVFVYVHGFNTGFDRAVFRFAQLAHDSDANAAPVLFSWPSRGRVFDYRRDLDNASLSRSDLANLLDVAADSPSVGEIVILAHSMGSWVAVEALKQMAIRHGRVPAKISTVILASPDLDVGVFRRQVLDMGPKRPQITLFVSQADLALQASAILSRGSTRLGAVNPEDEGGYGAELRDLEGVTILDLTALRAGDRINHSLYAASPEMVRLIGKRLIEGQVITDADVTPVDALGSAAELVVTAPIRVFEAARR
jgi:esterase/lipase superfamily enzyme